MSSAKSKKGLACLDVPDRKCAEEALRVSHRFLEIANRHTEMIHLLKEFVTEVRNFTGCAAVGVRILDAEGNIPYQAYEGFSQRFYESESPLSIRSDQCMCINVIKGTTDPKLSFFRGSGSFYMNGTTRFLATASEEEKGRTRNVCNQLGYESVALVPIRSGANILGLIHVADYQENMVPLEIVEVLEGAAMQVGTAIQRVWTEEALRESEERYRSLVESTDDAVYLIDRSLRFLYANKKYLSRYGLTIKKIAGLEYGKCHGAEGTAEFAGKIKKVIESGVSITCEHTSEKDGKIFLRTISPVREPRGGEVTKVTVISKDITERKRTEEEVRNLAKFPSENPNPVLRLNSDGIILYANEGSQALLRIWGCVIGSYAPAFWRDVVKETLTSRSSRTVDLDCGGQAYSFFLAPVLDAAYVNFYGQDITERKRMEDERTRMLADLEAKNKEMEAFVYTVSHDLKSPLVSLGGFSSILQKEYESQLGKEGKHYLERIQANIAHMGALITSLLEVSRLGQVVGPIKEIDVAALLREIRDALAIRLKEVGAEFVVQEPLPIVRADRGGIHQVFVNLIVNAVKFRGTERVLRIEVGCRQESSFYRFHVADNGIGIAPRYHEQIFAPFRKLHSEIEGMGIGLALVKKIVENHGGRVWVESPSTSLSAGNEGAGATFYFTLPMERRTHSLS